jgi:hypothetical protein
MFLSLVLMVSLWLQAAPQDTEIFLAPLTIKDRSITIGIGRSIQRIPGGGVSFVICETAEGQPPVLTIHELDPLRERK